MITESIRMVADWLADAQYGINAYLATVPRDTGVTQAANVTIYDETRHPEVARGNVPDTKPCVLVTTNANPLTMTNPAVRPSSADASMTVVVRYVTDKTDTHIATNDATQVMRCVIKSIGKLFVVADPQTYRVRAGIGLYEWSDYRADMYQSNDDATITAAVTLTVKLRDSFTTA